MDKRYLTIGVLAGVIALLLLISGSGDVGAVTYRMKYSTRLSCNGPNGVYNGGYGVAGSDDSCTNGTYGAYSANLTADILSRFSVPLAAPKYSNYKILRTFGTPSTWKIATDKEIPDGAAVGKLVSQSTLALFGSPCTTTLVVTIPMYDCSTDNSAGNLISWDATQAGKNLLVGKKGDVPIGCKKYPEHANTQAGGVKPRARYMGTTIVDNNMSPTQLQFLMFTSEQLSQLAAPQATIKDEQGYVNFVVLNNPAVPAPAGDSLDEFCTPLESNTTLWGRTGGFGNLNDDITVPWTCPSGWPCQSGNFWTVKDTCGDAVDNDGDNVVDEGCGIQRVKNPAANKGLWGTGTHPDGAYGESYLDIDADGINNDEDECPYVFDLGVDTPQDFIDAACDPTPGTADQDPDADNWRAQQDWCPLTFQTNQNDYDNDRIGDLCDVGSDDDADGMVDEGCSKAATNDDAPDDTWPNDGCLAVSAAETNCNDNVDDDADTTVNDGCPVLGSVNESTITGACTDAESGSACDGAECDTNNDGDCIDGGDLPARCANSTDDDADTVINDGCPQVGGTKETGAQCLNTTEDDGDGAGGINDGCPATARDNDGDTYVNDGCAGATSETGAQCTDGPRTLNGVYVNDQPSGGICIGATDADGDGFCDATEALNPTGTNVLSVGTQAGGLAGEDDADTPAYATPLCSNSIDDDGDTYVDALDAGCSVPEYTALDYAIVAAASPPSTAPRTCSNWSYYDSNSVNPNYGAGAQVNEDQDANTNAADANCGVIAGDTDQDGLLDAPDNCDNAWNPTQVDTDSDGIGDACDSDDDADGVNDNIEWANGTDAKNVCNPRNFDITANGFINSLDIGAFAQAVRKIGSPPADRPCSPATNYDVCR